MKSKTSAPSTPKEEVRYAVDAISAYGATVSYRVSGYTISDDGFALLYDGNQCVGHLGPGWALRITPYLLQAERLMSPSKDFKPVIINPNDIVGPSS
jgi:hypothetical protein